MSSVPTMLITRLGCLLKHSKEIRIFISSSGSDFFTNYGSGSAGQKVTVPTVPLPQLYKKFNSEPGSGSEAVLMKNEHLQSLLCLWQAGANEETGPDLPRPPLHQQTTSDQVSRWTGLYSTLLKKFSDFPVSINIFLQFSYSYSSINEAPTHYTIYEYMQSATPLKWEVLLPSNIYDYIWCRLPPRLVQRCNTSAGLGLLESIWVGHDKIPLAWAVGYNNFNNLDMQTLWWLPNKILRHIHKKIFSVFWAVSCAFAIKVYKKC